jgi:UDP-N-acetylmuramyl pentapeptide phosphotransferase/UDP-N-acetylglucosamine-1-phosphate transferase
MKDFSAFLPYLVSLFVAFGVALFSIPQIRYVAQRKRLLDLPDNHRKLHVRIVPNLGGVGIFFAYILTSSLLVRPEQWGGWNILAGASLILFATGLKDDLVSVGPAKKFLAQAAAAFIVAYFADIRLTSLHGVLGVHELPYWMSITFTVIGCTFVTNAFNLIDGIDGLAGSVGFLASLTLGVCLALTGRVSEACIAFSLSGAIAGFLKSNWSPATIFMGDTGALLIGFTLSVLCILLINGPQGGIVYTALLHTPHSSLLLALCVLFVPIFDTFRVFTTRIFRGNSPFRADRTHLHHYLLDLGFNHAQTVLLLVLTNAGILLLGYLVQDMNVHGGILVLLAVGCALVALLVGVRHLHQSRQAVLAGEKARNFPTWLPANRFAVRRKISPKVQREELVETV